MAWACSSQSSPPPLHGKTDGGGKLCWSPGLVTRTYSRDMQPAGSTPWETMGNYGKYAGHFRGELQLHTVSQVFEFNYNVQS